MSGYFIYLFASIPSYSTVVPTSNCRLRPLEQYSSSTNVIRRPLFVSSALPTRLFDSQESITKGRIMGSRPTVGSLVGSHQRATSLHSYSTIVVWLLERPSLCHPETRELDPNQIRSNETESKIQTRTFKISWSSTFKLLPTTSQDRTPLVSCFAPSSTSFIVDVVVVKVDDNDDDDMEEAAATGGHDKDGNAVEALRLLPIIAFVRQSCCCVWNIS